MTEQKNNAVLDDPSLIEGLRSINPVWGDMTVRVTGDANPFGAHVDMALKQGVTYDELEEMIVFASVYTGFNKGATTMGALNTLRHDRGDE